MTEKSIIPLSCPFCPYIPESKDFPREWLSNHIYEIHKIKIEYSMIISKLIAEQSRNKTMVPLSVIDAFIEKYKNEYDSGFVMEKLEEIKKEAVAVPDQQRPSEPSNLERGLARIEQMELEGALHCPVCHFDYTKQKRTKTLEQKIQDAIKQQEDFGIRYNKDYEQQKKDMGNHNFTDYDVKTKIRLATLYHLRKLLK